MTTVKKVCRLVKSKPKKKNRNKVAPMLISASRPDPFSGGPIPLKNKSASYFMTSGRNPILQIHPSSSVFGSIPSVAGFQTFPSTLDSEANAIQTFLGQRQSRVLDGGQISRKPSSTSIGTSTSGTSSQISSGLIKVSGVDSGNQNNLSRAQNAFTPSISPSKRGSVPVPRLIDVVDNSGDSIVNPPSSLEQAAYDALAPPDSKSNINKGGRPGSRRARTLVQPFKG